MMHWVFLTLVQLNEVTAFHASSRTSVLKRNTVSMTAREVSKSEVMSTMTMEKAYKMFLRMNRSSMDRALVSMVNTKIGTALQQDPAATASITTASQPTGYAAVDKARDMLNNMIDEAIMKKELEHIRCNEFDTKQIKILKELEMDIAYVNSEASSAKSEVLRCQEVIQVVEEVKLPTNRKELSEHNERCRTDIAALNQQLTVVRADIKVMNSILSMVCADYVAAPLAAQPNFLQTDMSSTEGSLIQCTTCASGAQSVWLRHSRIEPMLAMLKSQESKAYLQDNLMNEFDESQAQHGARTILLQDDEVDQQMGRSGGMPYVPALQTRFNASNPRPEGQGCNEQFVGGNSSSYQGCQDKTVGGYTCQAWNVQSPHTHTFTNMGNHNYCRNPDGSDTIWCFTTNPTHKWEVCEPLLVLRAPTGVTKRECKETNNCKLSKPNCEKLQDRFMVILAGIKDMEEKLSNDLVDLQTKCQEIRVSYENTISSLESQLKEEQTNLAAASKSMTENQQQSVLSNEQHKSMNKVYHSTMTECCDNRNAFTAEICALEKIRGELYRLEGLKVFITDCEVSDWVDEECSATCGGGKQDRKRTIIIHPLNGSQCPPLKMERECNVIGCPVDCQVGDWNSWGDCTASCNGGVMTRTRDRNVEPENGGDPCPEMSEERECNTFACNADCVLADWSAWSACTRQCNSGTEQRRKAVTVEAVGQGDCAPPDDPMRFDHRPCNTFDCKDLLPTGRLTVKCTGKVDVFLVIDGSGSLGRRGWIQSEDVAKKLVKAMTGGDEGVNMAVMLFSGPRQWRNLDACTGTDPNGQTPDMNVCGVHWVSRLSGDMKAVHDAISSMTWPRRTTLTSLALAEVSSNLIQGRQDANPVVVIITDGKPMSPIKTENAATALKERARLIWVPVGKGVKSSIKDMRRWASQPWSDNVMTVDDFDQLDSPSTINEMISGFCPQLE